ncbi:uncharacterized protein LOC117916816 [Vitis riparia]|uniref:uncharacterized protein LOC117916816 n=1 Tax=Vitis riparia TaxID=96939 RepID=UPI00155AAAE2|nr:uncharacterized protein LOC117916816 [Vitis riparia]
MVLAPRAKSSENHNQVMASANSKPLPTFSLSCQKLERNSPKDASHGDSQSKNRNNLGTNTLENGMCYGKGEVSTKLKLTIRHGEKKLTAASEKGMGREGQDGEELGQRTWNLRSRTNAVGGRSGISNLKSNIPENAKKNEKPKKFSITLSREEIEEDFLKMTGSKPPRKPNKRPKNVQKVLDNLTPGLWLHEVNPSSYNCKGNGKGSKFPS